MVFNVLAQKYSNKPSEKLFLGATEAEAEALPSSEMPLCSVYKDYHDLLASLKNERFIICGRKGSGKSAFAEYVLSLTKNEPNLFCKFIRQGEINLERIVQIGKESGHLIEKENLYTWLILTNVLKLFSDNQAINNNKEYKLLTQFLQKNSGYIDIREAEIKELVKNGGFEVKIEYMKRFLKSKHLSSIQTKQEKAPFYKLIPHLKEVILNVLKSPEEIRNGNSYVLFFDDLDISFKANDVNSVDSVLSLLRVSKEINNEFFSKNELESKVVILLRDDIAKSMSSHSSDTAKLFSSYSVQINWYQDEYHKSNPETDLNIRKFINSRIKYAFEVKELPCDANDPWLALVEDPFRATNQDEQIKTSFKYILDHTFFSPRDLIIFFSPLKSHVYKLPLSKQDVNQLVGRYCEEVVNELKNELSCFYVKNQIHSIFASLGAMLKSCKESSHNNSVSYQDALTAIEDISKDLPGDDLLGDLFERSLIGNMGSNGHVFFKHREPSSDTYQFNTNHRIVLHNAIRVYCVNKGYA